MQIGRLDRRITIQANTVTRDSVGEAVDSWSNLDTVWARIIYEAGREGVDMQSEVAQQQVTFIIRYRSDVTPMHRITYDSEIYHIEAVKELPRRKGLEISARAVASIGEGDNSYYGYLLEYGMVWWPDG